MDVEPGEPERNSDTVWRTMATFAARGGRLLLLPEMWPCGFVYSRLREMATKTPDILESLRRMARRCGVVVVGSMPEMDGDAVYNTSYVIDADGEVAGAYRKIHLFSLHGEHEHFGRGTTPLVCDTAVGRLGVVICYDLRFPELSRRLALEGAEILCASAMWPAPRVEHWSVLLRARAIENQVFVAGCNGCGVEGDLTYGGKSAVISPLGHILAEGGQAPELLSAMLDFEEMESFRKRIPCFEDRFPGAYGPRELHSN